MSANAKDENMAIDAKDGVTMVEDRGSQDAEKATNPNALTIDPERWAKIEKRLKLKLDARNSMFLLVYIMNYL